MADGLRDATLIESSDERKARERAEDARRDRRRNQVQAWFAGALTFATIVTMATSLYQNYILRESLKEQHIQAEAAKISAATAVNALKDSQSTSAETLARMQAQTEAAKIAATAAAESARSSREQLELARESNRLTEESVRGRIAIQGAGFDPKPAVGVKVGAIVTFTNSGHATADNLMNVRAITLAADLPDGPMPTITIAERPSVGMIAAGDRSQQRLEISAPITERQMNDLEAGRLHIYTYGRVTYTSLGVPHWLEYCFVSTVPPTSGSFSCHKWNRTDESPK